MFEVDTLLPKLTLAEKVQLLTGDNWWHTAALPAHGIPRVRMSDGPSGIRGQRIFGGTPSNCIPGGIALAATFDVELVERLGGFLAEEAKAKGAHIMLGPAMNGQRSPLYGRGPESFSEDPVLAGKISAAMINGSQNNGVLATAKHLVCYEQCTEMFKSDSVVSERAMREIYLRPFQICLKEADVKLLMTSYQKLNGLHASEHKELLHDIVREEWGFDGAIMSDWYGTYSTFESLEAGLDLEMPGPSIWWGERLIRGVGSGKISESVIDRSARRILGVIKHVLQTTSDFEAPEGYRDTPQTRATLLDAAAQSVVLLQNERENLPIKRDRVRKLAVIGPNATVPHSCPGGSAQLMSLYTVSALDAIREYGKRHDIEVEYAMGCTASRFLPSLDRLARSSESNKNPYDLRYYANDPSSSQCGEPTMTLNVPFSSGCMFDEYPRELVPRFFHMRLETIFTPDEDGTWEFGLIVVGRGKLYVDGQLVVDNTENQRKGDAFFAEGTVEEKGTIDLQKGRDYRIRLDFNNHNLLDGATTLQLMGAFRIGAQKTISDRGRMVNEAVKLARESDAVVLVVGLTPDHSEEGFDREDMKLPPGVDDLVSAVLEVNPNSTVVVASGSQCEMPWRQEAASVIHAFYGGNESGNGLAAVLFGEHNPSSKLPVTFRDTLEQFPSHPFFPGKGSGSFYSEDIFAGYRSSQHPFFAAFGHGLSYTTFEIHQPPQPTVHISVPEKVLDVSLNVAVTNTGKMAGAEVVQCYITPPKGTFVRPHIELAAFAKIYLDPQQRGSVILNMDRGCFSFWNPDKSYWEVAQGKYVLRIGNSSASLPLSVELEIGESFTWRGL